jgi:hypothetical protein
MSERPPSDPPGEPSNPNAQDLTKFVKDARRQAKSGGDVNVVDIDKDARVDQLAVGRNILQAKINIGSLVIPVRFLLVLLGVIAVLAVIVWWITTPGQMPPGGSAANVAIVEFGALDANGNVTTSSQGAYMADWLYNRLSSELEDLPQDQRPTFWHLATGFDPVHLFRKRTTSPIRNDADAERVAEQVGATIVIYGNLVPGQSTESFVPQFFVAQRKGEVDELSGSQQLGQPIPIPNPLSDEYLRINLQPIGRALVWFSRGLQSDLSGRYDEGYKILKQGEEQLTNWDEEQGKEVLYYFIGREALFVANCENDARLLFKPDGGESAISIALDTADEYFTRARDIAERTGRSYPRAVFGLGQVAFQRAQRHLVPPGASTSGQCRINITGDALPCPTPPPPPTDPTTLNRARMELDRAVTLLAEASGDLSDPPPENLLSRIRGAQANALTLGGTLFLLENKLVDAGADLQAAANQFLELARTTPSTDRRTVGGAYLGLGIAQRANGTVRLMQRDLSGGITRLESALNAFGACTSLIAQDEPDTFLRSNIRRNCFCLAESTQDILDSVK